MKGRNALIILGILCLASILVSQTQINSNSSNLQLFPKVAYTMGGKYFFAWVSNHQYQDKDFEILSRSADASTLSPYGSDEPLSASLTARSGHRLHVEMVPSVKAEGNDTGAIVAWVDHYGDYYYPSSPSPTVCVTRITGTGSKDNDFGTHDIHDAAFMTPPEMCSDGAGGLVFASLDSNYQRKLINDRLDRSVSFVWVGDISINIC